MNKRLLAAAAALCVCVAAFSGCVGRDVSSVGTINGTKIYRADYEYYLRTQATTIQNILGVSDDSWREMEYEGKNAEQAARDNAFDDITSVMVKAQKAYDDGLITEAEAEAEASANRRTTIEQMGGIEAYRQALSQMGLRDEAFERILKYQAAAAKTDEQYGSAEAIVVSDEDAAAYFEENYLRAKHILVSNEEAADTDSEAELFTDETATDASEEPTEPTEAPLPIDVANEIIAALDGGADFNALIAEYNSDPGQSETSSYVFTEGQMVDAFYQAAKELEVNAYTKEPVETSYGYHIIMRLPLSASDSEYEEQKETVIQNCRADKFVDIVDSWKSEVQIERDDSSIAKAKIN
ncbi:MAG: peptidylprolyl isomerase [Clostridia bacterium]|nr:peptidylprolyl isomerase [Clostridia bacterium]